MATVSCASTSPILSVSRKQLHLQKFVAGTLEPRQPLLLAASSTKSVLMELGLCERMCRNLQEKLKLMGNTKRWEVFNKKTGKTIKMTNTRDQARAIKANRKAGTVAIFDTLTDKVVR